MAGTKQEIQSSLARFDCNGVLILEVWWNYGAILAIMAWKWRTNINTEYSMMNEKTRVLFGWRRSRQHWCGRGSPGCGRASFTRSGWARQLGPYTLPSWSGTLHPARTAQYCPTLAQGAGADMCPCDVNTSLTSIFGV